MGKFFGQVGYAETVETSPGVWKECIKARNYYGDVHTYTKRYESREQVLDNLEVSNQISIVADPYAYEHFATMRYVEWMGVKWNVKSVEVQYPRLLISIGGVYNGEQA